MCLHGGKVSAANPQSGFDADSLSEFGLISLLLTLMEVLLSAESTSSV